MVLIIYMTKILGTGKLLVAILAVAVFLSSCVKFKKVDARKVPVNAQERAKLNVKEGRGMSLKNMVGNKMISRENLDECQKYFFRFYLLFCRYSKIWSLI